MQYVLIVLNMRCPFCNSENTTVKDSREYNDGISIKRRRVCLDCNSKFATLEQILRRDLIVIKKDGRKEIFDRHKLKDSVKVGSGKQLTEEQLTNVVENILNQIDKKHCEEITTKEIGNIVLDELKKINKVAFVRFASVYLNFEDTKDFKEFIKRIKED